MKGKEQQFKRNELVEKDFPSDRTSWQLNAALQVLHQGNCN